MLLRFILYSVFKNLRFFEAFFILYLIAPLSHGGAALSYFHVGMLTGYQKLLTAVLEVPSGFVADSWGRRRSVVLCFTCYSLAFPLYALAAGTESGRLVFLVIAQTLFGIGEAFRTGTHKAIMLDWLDQTPGSPDPVSVIGRTRFWSKLAAGVSALAGGVLLWSTGVFTWLFLVATLPAVSGVVLMATYPAWLDGEYARGDGSRQPSWKERLKNLRGMPGMALLLFQSVVFESQIKVAQHYIQPLLQGVLEERRAAVIGGIGALMIGLYYLVQDGVAALASRFSSGFARVLGPRSLPLLQAAAPLGIGITAVSLGSGILPAVILGLLILALVQNVRRPIFVAELNRVMDKSQRAATLSIESQSRSLAYAVLAPATGWVADQHGLSWGLAVLAGVGLTVLVSSRK